MSHVPPGYKTTEIGVIPEDWDVRSIGSIFDATAGGDFDPSRSDDIQDELHPYPVYSNALTDAGRYGYCNYADHKANSITVTARGMLGVANFRDHPFTAIGRVLVLASKEPCDGRYFADYINHGVSFAVESTGVPQLTAPQISKYQLPVPPLPEQSAIAAALADVDALLAALDRLIAKQRALKTAAMQQLLTGRQRLPGFTALWETKRIREIADVDPENLSSDTNPDYSFKYMSLEDIDTGTLLGYTEQIFRTAPSRARRKLRKGDVLVSTVRPNLKSHLLIRDDVIDTVCSTGFSVVRCKAAIAEPAYVYFHLFADGIERQIESLLTGSNYPAINSGDVKALQIPYPPPDEQTAIAAVLSDMDAAIAALEARRTKTLAVKQGMMQELLTGRTRLR